MGMKWLRLSVLCLSLFNLAEAQATSEPSSSPSKGVSQRTIQIAPTPSWVSAAPSSAGVSVPMASMHAELIDEQIRVEGASATTYLHVSRVVDQVDGLALASEIQAGFNPAYESLVFHTLEIWRNGVRINKLDRRKFKLLQREPDLEKQMYNGAMTAMVVLDDLRVGDRVEFAYSIKGINPVFDGRFVHDTWMASFKGPAKVMRLRLLTPQERTILHKESADVEVKERIQNGWRDTEFIRTAVPQVHGDQYTPPSAILSERVELSEFPDWKSVAVWGEKLYSDVLSKPAPLVKETVRKLGAGEGKTQAENLTLILNFVQNQIRYFGTEIGESSHRPSAPDAVIKQRFGDCKDKATLLVAMLREVGIAADPVLVSAQFREDVDEAFPSALAFDHVIARVTLGEQTYWLDGTRNGQTGPLEKRQSTGLGKGLILRAASDSLTEMPGTENEERMAVRETYRVKSFSEVPTLELNITYYGELAEIFRQAVAQQPPEVVDQNLNRLLYRTHAGMEKVGAVKVEDVEGQNAVRFVETFRATKFWNMRENIPTLETIYPLWGLIPPMMNSGEATRKQPYQIEFPGIYRHAAKIELPAGVITPAEVGKMNRRESDRHLSMSVDYAAEASGCSASGEIKVLNGRVTPAEWSNYTTLLGKIDSNLSPRCKLPLFTSLERKALIEKLDRMPKSPGGAYEGKQLVTSAQLDAMENRLISTAFLNSDRLPSEFRGDYLLKHGEALDDLGQFGEAKKDFDEAVRLKPNDALFLAAAAVNAFSLQEDGKATDLANRALQADPQVMVARDKLLYMAYLKGDYQLAKQHVLKAIKERDGIRRDYAALWLYLTAQGNRESPAAAVKPYLAQTQGDWPRPVLDFLMGNASWGQALEKAKDGQKDPSRLCELYYYAGEQALLEGRTQEAIDYFNKSVGTGVVEFNEYVLSMRRLAQLKSAN